MVKDNEQLTLKDTIIEAILNKKGKRPVVLNLTKLDQSIADYFIVCHGESNVQVDAISSFVERQAKNELQQNPYHKEGLENSQWILLDYGDIVVHVFQEVYRDFYKLEELWADAEVQNINEE